MCLCCWFCVSRVSLPATSGGHSGEGDSLGSLHPVPEVGLLLAGAAGTGGLGGQAQGCGAPGSFVLPVGHQPGLPCAQTCPGELQMQFGVHAAFGVLGQLQSRSGIQAWCSQCRLILQLRKCHSELCRSCTDGK